MIGCLGWGSLVWDPRTLPVAGEWRTDGPLLPLEFARESGDGRITIVLCDGVRAVHSCWAMLAVEDVSAGIVALAERESITTRIAKDIGWWNSVDGKSHGVCASEIESWAKKLGLDGVVWTNLPCGFKSNRGQMPTQAEVLAHFAKLEGEALEKSKRYVLMAPPQIDTEYRRALAQRI